MPYLNPDDDDLLDLPPSLATAPAPIPVPQTPAPSDYAPSSLRPETVQYLRTLQGQIGQKNAADIAQQDVDEMKAARDNDRMALIGTALGRGIAQFGAVRAGRSADMGAFDALDRANANSARDLSEDRAAALRGKVDDRAAKEFALRQDASTRAGETHGLEMKEGESKLASSALALQKAKEEETELRDPDSARSQFARATVTKLLPSHKLTGQETAAQLERSIPTLEKMWAAEQTRLARSDALKAKAEGKSKDDIDKSLASLKDDLDPNKSRGGNLAANQKRVDAAERLETLITDSGGNLRNLDQRQMEELAIGTQNMLSSGTGSAEQVRALIPSTIVGNSAKLKEWLLNEPLGTNQQEFVKRMAETVAREKDRASEQVRKAQSQRLSSHIKLLRNHPDEAKAVLQGYGFDPADVDFSTGLYAPKSKGKASDPALDTRPKRTDPGTGETRSWDAATKKWVK